MSLDNINTFLAYWEPLPAAASTGVPVPLPFTATAMFRAQGVSALRSRSVTTSSITSYSPRLSIYDLTSDEDEVQFLGSGSVERIRATTNAESLDARFAVLGLDHLDREDKFHTRNRGRVASKPDHGPQD
ncbi:uncharacterized protein RSE6_11286 [Rhynchosporium secalis]|uniref:Uncharacterized protein n=1 Tax=Rhynchosporium secalis TaxID=38038 RepID=A0A1E1MMK5_RHYSE|nr:uncharacterized protein RSE6_11286 [Rhynchosporium secalis]